MAHARISLACFKSFFFRPSTREQFDLVCVLPPSEFPQWILHAICTELKRNIDGRVALLFADQNLPPANSYFFSHILFFETAMLRQPEILRRHNIVLFTHPKEDLDQSRAVRLLNLSGHIACMCGLFTELLKSWGVASGKIHTILLGADSDLFLGHKRGHGRIGFCSAYYARKNPSLVLGIVERLPHRQFVLVGRNWQDFERFDELIELPNLEYKEIEYADYPQFYGSLDVFVSPSRLEGGPMPLLEAMMSNVFPVASNTGHAPDLIADGVNGFLFEPDDSVEHICGLIECALQDTVTDIRSTVKQYTWQRFASQIRDLLLVQSARG